MVELSKPNDDLSWDRIAGLEHTKDVFKEALILPLKFPQLFTGNRQPYKTIMLFGPPGTGKTHITLTAAAEAGASYIRLSASIALQPSHYPEPDVLIRDAFKLARANHPAILILDDLECLSPKRQSKHIKSQPDEGDEMVTKNRRLVKAELLVQLEDASSAQPFVVAVTNRPWSIDPAVRRRFEKRLYIPLPNEDARQQLFTILLAETKTEHQLEPHELDSLATATEGYSGSDVNCLVRDAMMQPLRALQQTTHFKAVKSHKGDRLWAPCCASDEGAVEQNLTALKPEEIYIPPLHYQHFASSLPRLQPSVHDAEVSRYQQFCDEYGRAGA
eukprot:TRINITY_DN94250_c0_g1_i1.p1 TRINITY_DN94250_c0_g1~~TRINITY_DN94250_c0_g1_i1.p1  ORF type:complete len:331 (-),score=21.61 TRINITY_DN94250_c0_g1_i1:132-1124(-)